MTEYTDEDMAAVGRALMQAIAQHAPPGWHPADCPSEIVADLAGQLTEAREALGLALPILERFAEKAGGTATEARDKARAVLA
ncbi:hypothetical protein [Metapseudomonas furukawaii]|uniref:Uncharacterized protein n=1 Tax=Metapseudomonas furukawaii TaxID=1149133 RepID=L8MH75_METFU|nr:hypothetical protein [Pseudomonas furukawaii]ELS25353.1 hypothetical protein ppKF707_2256 [Pseudomonas furukawaii]ELS27565.1 hypothetical protein ppKF707_4937 [Pseudomonas furukawaii]BAU77442.1 hypothetical protein KF707C_p530 [Pseudomonas furukawaii]